MYVERGSFCCIIYDIFEALFENCVEKYFENVNFENQSKFCKILSLIFRNFKVNLKKFNFGNQNYFGNLKKIIILTKNLSDFQVATRFIKLFALQLQMVKTRGLFSLTPFCPIRDDGLYLTIRKTVCVTSVV